MKHRHLNDYRCIDDAVNELFLDTWSKTEVEEVEDIERTGKIELEDV